MSGNAIGAGEVPAYDYWRNFATRGVVVAAFSVAIALILTALGDTLGLSLIYSLCIGLTCWLFIDPGGNFIAGRLSMPAFGKDAARAGPRGWAWMVMIIVVGATLGNATGNGLANLLTGLHKPGPFDADFWQVRSVLLLALLPAVAISYFLISREVMAMQKAEVESAQRQAAEQQLKLLESQLEPHMLFNTLANLRALIGIDPPRAQAMLDQLIAFLRASLDGSRASVHSVESEFQRLRDYLALMQVRMGSRLATSFELPPALTAASVPPLLLQPLVENSIKHGLEPQVAGGRIDISAAREGDALVLRVRDDGAGFDAGSVGAGHYGLAHVRERLATLYGARASFTLGAADGDAGGTLATIRLPLQTIATEAARRTS